jgi:hypothetical protein
MYSPTYFSINSKNPSTDIKVNLCKENWHNVHHSGEVKGKGLWKNQFKTEGDFGIMVVAKKLPAKYVLLVWTGDEMKIEMPSVFKSGSGSSIKGASWIRDNMVMVVIAGVLVLSLLVFGFFKVRMKKNQPGQPVQTNTNPPIN